MSPMDEKMNMLSLSTRQMIFLKALALAGSLIVAQVFVAVFSH
ncbi:MAG TPA: hypothetical protein VIJ85_11995 [Rhizomicrobium sp.]